MSDTEFAILYMKGRKDIHRREGRDQKSLRQLHVVIASGVCAHVYAGLSSFFELV